MDSYVSTSASQCLGKEPFASRLLAEKVAKRRNRSRHQVVVYRCAHCHNYHLGSSFKKWRNS